MTQLWHLFYSMQHKNFAIHLDILLPETILCILPYYIHVELYLQNESIMLLNLKVVTDKTILICANMDFSKEWQFLKF